MMLYPALLQCYRRSHDVFAFCVFTIPNVLHERALERIPDPQLKYRLSERLMLYHRRQSDMIYRL